ncbi:MAG: hypothetical protein OEY23_09775 [Acidimicrobiia bacterium]|nr:hypothetical protein [Acidimicrobiia bacterium]
MTRRSLMLTAASVAGVVLASAAAITATFSILNATDSGGVGELSAARTRPTSTASTDRTAEPVAADGIQRYAVDSAGLVTISTGDGRLALIDARPNPGWDWNVGIDDGRVLVVEFRSADAQVDFVAERDGEGSVRAQAVRQQGSTSLRSSAAASTSPTVTAPPVPATNRTSVGTSPTAATMPSGNTAATGGPSITFDDHGGGDNSGSSGGASDDGPDPGAADDSGGESGNSGKGGGSDDDKRSGGSDDD